MTKYIVAVTFTGGENQINVEKYSTFLIASGIHIVIFDPVRPNVMVEIIL